MKKLNRDTLEERPSIERLSFYVVLTAALITSIVNIVRDGVHEVVAPVEISEMIKKSDLDVLSYSPPAEFGSIVKRKIDPTVQKTIIYVLDSHPQRIDDLESVNIQKDLYYIFKDYIAKYGTLSMVIENWLNGAEADDYNLDNLNNAYDDPHLGNGLIQELIKEKDFSKRQALVEENLGKTIVPAGMFAMFAYPELKPIGSVNQFQLEMINRSMEGMGLAQLALEYPQHFPCDETNTFSLADARYSLERGVHSQEVVNCYCGVRSYLSYVIPAFMNGRFVEAPRREIKAAIDNENDVVMVVAGVNHLPMSLELMDKEDVNYLVVSPKSLSSAIPTSLKELPVLGNLPDDSQGTCKKFQDALQVRQNEEFVEWFMEDEEASLDED